MGATNLSLEDELVWLHLSDIPIDPQTSGWDYEGVLGSLVKDLEQHRDKGLRPDVIFITGDLAFGELPGNPMVKQYEVVQGFIDRVCQSFTPSVPRGDVYVVPGNHDVNRKRVTKASREYLEFLRKSSRDD